MKVRIIAGVYEGMTGEVVEINFDNGMSRIQLDGSLTVPVRSQETEAIEEEDDLPWDAPNDLVESQWEWDI